MENLSLAAIDYQQMGNIVSAIAIALIIATSCIGAQVIAPDVRVPMQFGQNGKPTWFAPRWFALVFIPLAAIVFMASLWVMTGDGGYSISRPNHERIIFTVRALSAVVYVVLHAAHLFFAARYVARQRLSGSS